MRSYFMNAAGLAAMALVIACAGQSTDSTQGAAFDGNVLLAAVDHTVWLGDNTEGVG